MEYVIGVSVDAAETRKGTDRQKTRGFERFTLFEILVKVTRVFVVSVNN